MQTVRSGQKVDGKTRYFRTGGCAVPEQEARSVFGPAPPLAEVRHRGADGAYSYVRFGTSVFGFAITIEEARGRTAQCMQIYVRSATPARGFANSLEDPRISGALARKRSDAAKKSTVEYGAFGPEVAPFPSERRGPFSDQPPLSRK